MEGSCAIYELEASKSIFVYVYNVGFHDLLRLNGATTMQVFGPFMQPFSR